MKIAIIGSGISGLGAAYLLHPHHDITVYEKNAYLGGHSRTIEVTTPEGSVPVDTGFIVYNERNYPHLTKLFKHLDVPVQKSSMSFGVSIGHGWLEYASTGMLAQKRNLLRPRFWGMIADVIKFNRVAPRYLSTCGDVTLRQCLDDLRMGQWFRDYYLQAMGAAIWSCSAAEILEYPARSFLQFFKNHGLLTINDHPQWYTVTGGSREYVTRLSAAFKDRIRLNCGAKSISRADSKVIVHDMTGKSEIYDAVVFGCHGDEALSLLADPTTDEQRVLGGFSYQPNQVIVHSDTSFMPKRKSAYASWIYLSDPGPNDSPVVSLSYWMNLLQSLKTQLPIIITLNPCRRPAEHLIHDEHSFSHPVFNLGTMAAQREIATIQGQKNTFFCGAYQQNGFHEDGLRSAVNVASHFGVSPPWL